MIRTRKGLLSIDFFCILYNMKRSSIYLLVKRTSTHKKKIRTAACRKCRLPTWTLTNTSAMKQFIAFILWIGLVYMPKLRDSWSRNYLYRNTMARLISRNRIDYVYVSCVWQYKQGPGRPFQETCSTIFKLCRR